MEEEVGWHPVGIQIPDMPHRQDHRVYIELEDRICALFSKERVPHAHVTQIIEDPHLFDIWCTLPRDMMTMMCHVVNSLMLIQRLQDRTQYRSSHQLDDVPSDAYHDSLSSHALGEWSTPPQSPSHVSPDVTQFNDSPQLLGLPYIPSSCM